MFNIKSIVKQITERSRDSNPESPNRSDDTLNSQKAEGFLCPKCMKQFPSPWELQSHYESLHDELLSGDTEPIVGSLSLSPDEKEHLNLQQDGKTMEDMNSQASLSVEDVPLLTDVADLQDRLCQVLNRKAVLESRIVQLVQTNVSLKTSKDELERSMAALQERHNVIEAQLAHRESIDDAAVLRQELVQVQRMMDEMNREREKERDALQAELHRLQEEQETLLKQKVKDALLEKEQESVGLAKEVEMWKLKCDELNVQLNDETSKRCNLEESMQMNSSTEPADSDSGREISELRSALQKLRGEYKGLTSQLQNVNSENQNLKSQLSRKDQEQEDIRRKLRESESQVQKVIQEGEKSRNIIKSLQIEHEDLQTKVKEKQKLMDEKLALEKQLLESREECSALKKKIMEMQQTLAELKHEQNSLQDEHQLELKRLHESIQNKSESLQKQEAAVHLLVEERADLAQRLEEVETTKTKELTEARQLIEGLEKDLASKVESLRRIDANLSTERERCESLQEELNSIKEKSDAELQIKSEELKHLQASLDEVAGEKLALEAQLETTCAEQQKLLETCYTANSEVESLQHTVSELRRKWEESEAALQELGRENATLQLDIDRLLARKWAEDADVSSCTLCNRDFTMLLRKHHCRNCGQIFCNECSLKTTPVAVNKKPVRVCDSCYNELTSK